MVNEKERALSKLKALLTPEEQEELIKLGQGYKNIIPLPTKDNNEDLDETEDATPWPEDLKEQAYYGLAGDVVEAILPYTEADPTALLINFLVGFGNIAGKKAYTKTGADIQGLNLFALIVGNTAKARKGSSWSPVREILKRVDPNWSVVNGLSSGEGLIYHVRDEKWGKKNNKETGEYEPVLLDEGVKDKRLMVVESEFASLLKVMAREGNTLSPVIRQAWDGIELFVLTRTNDLKATNAHISLIGHITIEELQRYIKDTEVFNGFANRFIWQCVRRSKLLPDIQPIPDRLINQLVLRVRDVLNWIDGLQRGIVTFDDEAFELWKSLYPKLSEEKSGLIGAMTSRAEPQVLRLSTLYAVLDKSEKIRIEHILPAIAIWERSVQSIQFIFGDSEDDPIQNAILEGLKRGPMTQTDINNKIFQRNVDAKRIREALKKLSAGNKIVCIEEKTGKGRPKRVWTLKK